MTAGYYVADTQNGDHIDDPSEDALFMLLDDLAHPGNTFVTVRPADPDAVWSAWVALLDDGTYQVERHHPGRGEHTRAISADRGQIALDLTIWLAAQFPPRRPATRQRPGA